MPPLLLRLSCRTTQSDSSLRSRVPSPAPVRQAETDSTFVAGSVLGVRGRSNAPATSTAPSAGPTRASPAPTQLGAVQPNPAAITRPPRKAPAAFARLNAEWFA